MQVKNPNHISVVEQFVIDNKTNIEAYMASNAALQFITFDKIRGDYPALADKLDDSTLIEIFKSLGYAVLPEF